VLRGKFLAISRKLSGKALRWELTPSRFGFHERQMSDAQYFAMGVPICNRRVDHLN
jgi:hypothetical protein